LAVFSVFDFFACGFGTLPVVTSLPINPIDRMSELAAQTFVVLLGRGQPHPVVPGLVELLAQNEDDLFPDVDPGQPKNGRVSG